MAAVQSGKLRFGVNDEGNRAVWSADGTPLHGRENGDFWRMYVDDGKYRDCPVYSSNQRGTVRETENGVEISYDGLVDDVGKAVNVRMMIRVTSESGKLRFDAHIENNDARVRINEFKLPFMDMDTLCSYGRGGDVICRPNGLGEKVPNPWGCAKMSCCYASISEYTEPTQNEYFNRSQYPGALSMGWMGVETGGHFLYLAQHDELFRQCDLTFGTKTRTSAPTLMLEISHFPVLKKDETEDIAPTFVALFEGDWRKGSACYRQWAEETWWTEPKVPTWLRNMTGREKVILRHGNGQLLHPYQEIPHIMKKALECGLPLLEVYGWHTGGQDNDYPNYTPDPEQGGEEALREAIEEVHKMGGRISLYGQGEVLDTENDFYQQTGRRICRKGMLMEPYYSYWNYSSGGSFLRRYNHFLTHVCACQATEEWHDLLCEETKKFLGYGADGVFWDMEGYQPPAICFDESHLHGARGDREAFWRSKNIRDLHEICLEEDHAFGIEYAVDFLSKDADYTMGCWGLPQYPFYEMFRHTFPEIVVTNRWCDDENEGYVSALNEAFLYGLRWNISIFRTRGTLYDVPNYAEYLKKLTGLQMKYAEYLLRGKFCVETGLAVPDCVKYTEYKAEGDERRRLFVLWNKGTDIVSVSVMDKTIVMQPYSIDCVEWEKR